jgi:hypothetical protein
MLSEIGMGEERADKLLDEAASWRVREKERKSAPLGSSIPSHSQPLARVSSHAPRLIEHDTLLIKFKLNMRIVLHISRVFMRTLLTSFTY